MAQLVSGLFIEETKVFETYFLGQMVEIDLSEYYINDIGKIIGILSNILTEEVF
ncbi:hypothetical protein N0Y54_34890 [Nostoc punctiforme UO1]|uniref:hypothetical protein n=1 Tax=Nostoc punctiforme TaxID=272131 RepID=UPI0030B4BAB9